MTSTSDWERAQRKLGNLCPGCGVDIDQKYDYVNKCTECHARLVKELRQNIKMLDSAQANDRRYIQVSLEAIADIAATLSDKK